MKCFEDKQKTRGKQTFSTRISIIMICIAMIACTYLFPRTTGSYLGVAKGHSSCLFPLSLRIIRHINYYRSPGSIGLLGFMAIYFSHLVDQSLGLYGIGSLYFVKWSNSNFTLLLKHESTFMIKIRLTVKGIAL